MQRNCGRHNELTNTSATVINALFVIIIIQYFIMNLESKYSQWHKTRKFSK